MMKMLAFIFTALVLVSGSAFAKAGVKLVCEDHQASVETYRNSVNETQVAVVAKVNGIVEYSHVFDEYHEASPVPAWILTEVIDKQNIIAVVATSDTEALADISLTLIDGTLLRMVGASCSIL